MFQFDKLDTLVFSRMSNLVVNTWVYSLMFPLSFFMLQTYLDLQIFMFSSFLDSTLKLLKLDSTIFPALINLVINTCPTAF
jgi:hypothetical protein